MQNFNVPSSVRWLWGVVVACTLTVGCGGAGTGGSAFENDDGGNTPLYDATTGINFGGDATVEDSGPPSDCTPRTCAQAGVNCGPIGDGCGNQISCGTCSAPQTCGGGGTPSVCGGTAACVPATCTTLGVNCGQQGDGCGNVINCGTCSLPQTCGGGNADGGGGTPSVCGGSAGCIALTTCPSGMNCGAVADGCGGLVECAGADGGVPCPSGTTCGGGGSPNTCGASNELPDGGFGDADINTCVPIPQSTACAGLNCGEQSNGCGSAYTCGAPCIAPETCGGGGTHSVCGGNSGCIPLATCPSQMNCGVVADGCGGSVNCSPDGGTCAAPETCGGGGQPNVCGGLNVLADGGVIDGGVDLCVPISQGTACAGFNCGLQSNGCGGTYDCGTCTAPETCGGGGTDSVCGGNSGCVPATSCPSPMNCGVIGNGCGGLVSCAPDGGTCPASETCGGGGQSNVCGALNVLSDGGIIDGGLNVCTPVSKTVACTGIGCGQTGDGCGGLYTCGTCPSGESCGGGGTAFQCGSAPCSPITSCPTGECGTIANGCGGTVTCASCASGETCGGAGTPFQCGTPPCNPITVCPSGVTCGPWANGCGGVITSCGTCTAPETCGGAGGDAGSVCGAPACTPTTVCPTGVNCGTWPNGCDGGTISCGTCAFPLVCGATTPGECGGGLPDGGTACSGVNCYLAECDGGATTSLTGWVYDPAGRDVLYNVVVYVPQSLPSALTHGPQCNSCGSLYTGNPLTAATTDATGKFVLTNVPVMANLPIVLQIGEWRRQMVIANKLSACVNTTLGPLQTLADGGTEPVFQLPSEENQPGADAAAGPWEGPGTIDDLPQIAVSTGGADSMECLLLRIGVSSSEYTSGAGGTGHIHIFQGSATSSEHNAAWVSSSTPSSKNNLWDSTTDLDPYDIVVLSCEGEETVGAEPTNLHTYATNGGRAFASHYHYKWFNQAPYSGENLGTWFTGSNAIYERANGDNQLNARIVQALSDGGTPMKTWLGTVNALGGSAPAGELFIDVPRFNVEVTSANTPSESWIVPDDAGAYYYNTTDSGLPSTATEYFSFNTPTGGTGDASAPYCGRIVYSDLHVGAASNDYPTTSGKGDQPIVPTQCATGALSPQEKALEYMLFDLSSCVGSDSNLPTPPSCTPLTACPANYTCGPYPNGCGTGNLDCGTCGDGGSCVDGKCTACVPLTACPANYTCGEWPDGCGGTLQCGVCEGGTACINGACSSGCTPETCSSQNITCGSAGNGCGGVITSCGPACASGQACKNGACASACTPLTACPTGECGTIGDGCGGTVTCPPCPGSETCGGGGVHFQCGQADANLCVPLTCAEQHIFCGPAGDGCGGEIQCGQCDGGTCGGGGSPGVCGSPNCTPLTCGSLHCGDTGDGCGGTLDCGTCTPPLSCGGGGTNGVCGAGDANACIPNTTCTSCGVNGDGCGGTFNCPCATGTCGGGGVAGVCGSPTCVPLTCAPLQCGQTGDGCGGVLNCIQCASPESCGGGGVNGVCGEGDANLCVPNTTCTTCGLNGDGCGGTFTCPCPTGETCGGGGVAGVCGSPVCTPKTCTELNANCGQVADGCGGLTADCGTCTNGQTCGGGGTSNQCGAPQCTAETCQQLGANCGPVADGCGGIIQCGTCIAPDTCGGGGTPSQCGSGGIK